MHWKLHSICGKIIILKNNLEKMYKKWGKAFCSEFSLPLQLAIHHHAGEQKSLWDKTNKRLT